MISLNKTAASLITVLVMLSVLGGCARQVKQLPAAVTDQNVGNKELNKPKDNKAEGYRGIWYRLGRDYEYGDKYSGGLGTYTANHKPLAVYSESANKTFFVVGGTPAEDQQYLLILAGAYDHATHKVSRPTIVYNKGAEGVYDAHDNASISLDADGHVWIFVAGRNVRRDGTLLRSTQPHSVEAFETIRIWPGMTYPQPWYDNNTFHFFFTKYTRPRNLYFASSTDGKTWSEDKPLARFGGHYQVSGVHQHSGRIATFFNYHPESNVDRRTNLYYIESTDGGVNWTTVDGIPLELPLTEIQNPALVIDYEARGLLQYTCDLNWDAEGNPLLLYVVSPYYEPGPTTPARQWHLTRWTGSEWTTSVITETSHNYDMGSLHVEGNRWSAFLPSGDGPQLWGTGGEVEKWTTDDGGQNWILQSKVTQNSQYNHMYVRRPVNARDPFFAFWADGDTEQAGPSHFYFSNSDGTRVWRLPYTMTEGWETPEEIDTVSLSVKAGQDDLTIIKERVVEELMKPGTNDERVKEIIGRMNEDGSFQGINYADLTRVAGFPQGRHTGYLVYLARAYKNSFSVFYNDTNLKNSITRGLKFWVDNDFIGDNWHNNQITTPTNLVNLMLLIGDKLPDELVEQVQPMIRRATMEEVPGVFYGARPGGDRIAIAAIVAKNFLFLNDKEAFDDVIQIIAGEIRFNTGERGMQHDYSFHHRHDRVDNTTSYGYGKYANTFGEWSSYVANTKYQFPTDRINHLVDYYLDGIYKHMAYGVYIDIAAYDRSITHQRTSTPRGTLEIERLLQSTDYRSAELNDILKLRRGEEARIRSFAKFFWQTEYFAFQRPNFFTSVRMHSTRNRNNEEPYNGPGIVIHHRSDGANYLSLDGHEYDGIWPVYDWQKVSGATIMQKPENHIARMFGGNMPVQMEGLTDFVGGVDDGLYGAVVYDFKSPHDLIEAKKSWFFFDNEYVCLGSGIKSNPDLPAYTTINQAHLRGNVTVSQGGPAKVIPLGKNDLEKVKWVHHNRVGYIFPEPVTVNLSNRAEHGRWSDITAALSAPDELVTLNVFLLGVDHGNRPMNASYEYIVVPDVTPEEMASTSISNRNIRILSNTPDLQGVIHNELGICQLAFYKAGEVEISDEYTIKMDSQGMAMLKMNGTRIEELSVSDPSRKLTRITLTIPGIYNTRGENFRTLPDNNKNSTLIIVDMPTDVYAGSSVTIKL